MRDTHAVINDGAVRVVEYAAAGGYWQPMGEPALRDTARPTVAGGPFYMGQAGGSVPGRVGVGGPGPGALIAFIASPVDDLIIGGTLGGGVLAASA